MIFGTIDENYILDAINQLKNGKASGPDKVSITIVKDVKRPHCKTLGNNL